MILPAVRWGHVSALWSTAVGLVSGGRGQSRHKRGDRGLWSGRRCGWFLAAGV